MCVTPRVCVRVFVCVWNARERRERERYEGKTDRTPGEEKTAAF